jgi:hypothetical protein
MNGRLGLVNGGANMIGAGYYFPNSHHHPLAAVDSGDEAAKTAFNLSRPWKSDNHMVSYCLLYCVDEGGQLPLNRPFSDTFVVPFMFPIVEFSTGWCNHRL